MFGTGKGGTVAAGYSTEGKKIKDIKELRGSKEGVRLFGYLLTKDNGYGPGVMLCGEHFLVGSMPARAYKSFVDAPQEEKDAITSGRVWLFDIKEGTTKRGQVTTFYRIDCEEEYLAWKNAQ